MQKTKMMSPIPMPWKRRRQALTSVERGYAVETRYWRARALGAEAQLAAAQTQIKQLTERIERARRELTLLESREGQ